MEIGGELTLDPLQAVATGRFEAVSTPAFFFEQFLQHSTQEMSLAN